MSLEDMMGLTMGTVVSLKAIDLVGKSAKRRRR
jgi:hypothetical protein